MYVLVARYSCRDRRPPSKRLSAFACHRRSVTFSFSSSFSCPRTAPLSRPTLANLSFSLLTDARPPARERARYFTLPCPLTPPPPSTGGPGPERCPVAFPDRSFHLYPCTPTSLYSSINCLCFPRPFAHSSFRVRIFASSFYHLLYFVSIGSNRVYLQKCKVYV